MKGFNSGRPLKRIMMHLIKNIFRDNVNIILYLDQDNIKLVVGDDKDNNYSVIVNIINL